MRQFGWVQHIPIHCNTDMVLHSYNLRGRHEQDWATYLAPSIQIWEGRRDIIIHEQPTDGGVDVDPQYDHWFATISRRYLTKAGASYHFLVRFR